MRVDLRSDTVTVPSPGMRDAISHAIVGDDVYGEDGTVNSLEERVATLFGKDAALFTPTGSLANQLGIRSLVSPGEELLAESNSHIVRAELGAGAVFSGITTRTWSAERGLLNAEDALSLAHPDAGPYLVSTTAIAIENTHNFGGGTVQPIEEIKKLREESSKKNIALHLDGARIWNAHIASGVPLAEYARHFDTVSVCLSKGLGAPVGSLLLSTHDVIKKARVWRKRYGAGMRQVGILAAAGHYALDHNLSLLSQDHQRAKSIAIACRSIHSTIVDPRTVETNIVCLELKDSNITSSEFSQQAKSEGVLISVLAPTVVRAVTHLDISDEQLEYGIKVLTKLLERAFVSK